MATLQQVIDEIQADLRTISGIRAAPDEAPEQINLFPFVVAYPGAGRWYSDVPGSKILLASVIVELHVARKDLSRDIVAAMTYAESVPNKLLYAVAHTSGDRFNNTVSTLGEINYTFGPLGWGGMDTFGFRWTITGIKLQSNIT
jgi:hypothetical protein